MRKLIKLSHKIFLEKLEKDRGKPIFPEDIKYVASSKGNGVGIIIDRTWYDLEAISEKVEEVIE